MRVPCGPCLTTASAAAILCGCTPSLDWRLIRPEGTSLTAQFPCKPARQTRVVRLPGKARRMSMMACTTASATWAVAWIDDVEPVEVGQVMAQLRQATAGNVGADLSAPWPFAPVGATPNPEAGRTRGQGRRPDGQPVIQDMALLSSGTQVIQLLVHTQPPGEAGAVEQFFGEVRLLP